MSNPISNRAGSMIQPQTSRAAWREEMLGQLLAQMRERKTEVPEKPAPVAPQAYGKGQRLDVYV
jgi:hypothetical protein